MLNGNQLRNAMISGANSITNHRVEVDELNIFPVPDGDTGTNMSMTIGAGAKELAALADDTPIAEVARTCAAAMLRRGMRWQTAPSARFGRQIRCGRLWWGRPGGTPPVNWIS